MKKSKPQGCFCQTCDNKREIKYAKKGIYSCVRCKEFSEVMPQILLLGLLLLIFYAFIIWYDKLKIHYELFFVGTTLNS